MIQIDFYKLAEPLQLEVYFISSTLQQVSKSSCCSCLAIRFTRGSFKRFDVAANIAENIKKREKHLAMMSNERLSAIFRNVQILTDKFSKKENPEDLAIKGILNKAAERLTLLISRKNAILEKNAFLAPVSPLDSGVLNQLNTNGERSSFFNLAPAKIYPFQR